MGMAGRCLKAEPDAINKHPSPPSRAGACPGGGAQVSPIPAHKAHPARRVPRPRGQVVLGWPCSEDKRCSYSKRGAGSRGSVCLKAGGTKHWCSAGAQPPFRHHRTLFLPFPFIPAHLMILCHSYV